MVTAIAPELASQLGAIDLQSIAIYAAMGITTNIDSALSMLSMYIPFMGLMAAAYALIAGVNALAGEEKNGTLENVLAMPLRRRRIVIAKAWALAVAVASSFHRLSGLRCRISRHSGSTRIVHHARKLLLGSLEPWPLCFAFAMLGMLLGAFLPRRIRLDDRPDHPHRRLFHQQSGGNFTVAGNAATISRRFAITVPVLR